MTFSSASHQFPARAYRSPRPFLLRLLDTLSSNFHRLNFGLPRADLCTEIAYSYKTNYVPAVCKTVHALGGLAEVGSVMEWEMASLYGVPPSMVIYNGPTSRAAVSPTQSPQGPSATGQSARLADAQGPA